MLNRLTIENFKSLKKVWRMKFSPITALFGANSSGKSSILQFLLLLKQTKESADRTQVLFLGDEKSRARLGVFGDIIFSHDYDKILSADIRWDLDEEIDIRDPARRSRILFSGDRMGLSFNVQGDEKNRIVSRDFSYRFGGNRFTLRNDESKPSRYRLGTSVPNFKFTRVPGRVWDLPGPVKFYGFPDQVRTYYQNASFLSDFELEFEKLCDSIFHLGPLREHPKREYIWSGASPADMGPRGEMVVDAILASREREEKISRGRGLPRFTVEQYVAWWLKELGLIQDFRVEPIASGSNIYRVLVTCEDSSVKVPITDVGFGVSQILPVLTICYYVPEGSTVLLEQPEIHLHPKVQCGLADVFIDAVKNRRIQIVVESHSEHFLRRLQRRIAEEEFSAEDASIYFCEMDNGVTDVMPLEVDMLGNITNWPEAFFGDEFGEMSAINDAMLRRKRRANR